jgi:hypothetical protein
MRTDLPIVDFIIKNNEITDIIEVQTNTRIPKVCNVELRKGFTKELGSYDVAYVTSLVDGYERRFNWKKLKFEYKHRTTTNEYRVNFKIE